MGDEKKPAPAPRPRTSEDAIAPLVLGGLAATFAGVWIRFGFGIALIVLGAVLLVAAFGLARSSSAPPARSSKGGTGALHP